MVFEWGVEASEPNLRAIAVAAVKSCCVSLCSFVVVFQRSVEGRDNICALFKIKSQIRREREREERERERERREREREKNEGWTLTHCLHKPAPKGDNMLTLET